MLRRDFLRTALLGAAGLGMGAGALGCGGGSGGGSGSVAEVRVDRASADATTLDGAAAAVLAFTADLYRKAAAAGEGNLVCSPYSVAVALGMTRAGARGQTGTEMDLVLHSLDTSSSPEGPAVEGMLHPGLNALAQLVESRAGKRERSDGSEAEISLDVANSLWGQRDLRWQEPFLETLARYYGTGMRQVDYKADAAGAGRAINRWVSDQTHERIPELLAPGLLNALTRLVLVNALYLRAPWDEPFGDAQPAPFTLADGSVVSADLMSVTLNHPSAYQVGPGWRAVDIPYAGGELAMAVVLPDEGRFDETQASLDGPALRGLLTGFSSAMVNLDLPRWTMRTKVQLGDLLAALGMPTAFTDDADFSGMTTAEPLKIDKVIHEAFIAVDEEGTEAAAATAVVMEVAAGAPDQIVDLTVDRPYLFVIHDVETATPLFIGRVADPTAE
ncbi:serpin family protein [Frankia sp. CNm7]|uniref:Serpin family protein n=1 Tax=Frankia nepalensis TaxID=1836974 RepID=A0A937RKA2_9ACTN|nr:serpin family protein [Frankia nepalensis]MBL7496503.1 serpin family protein [Frankia nepalensis]MBL7511354.1 serpin family protein [Frankia nepalensis]MBL7521142.1 serpin family protein [Frankia nepalensis]MBL7627476.1 serpin family protein [Frankia nepalensis]